MRVLLAVLITVLVSCQGRDGVRESEAEPLQATRIRTIETALERSIRIEGEPVATATLAERMERYSVPGVSIAVIDDGAIDWARGYGLADVETGRPVTPRTLFQAASISKPVAAMAALKLVEQGRLELDADVNGYLLSWKIPVNEFTERRPVTLRQLLTHTAGLTVHGFPGYARDETVPGVIGVLDGQGNTDPVRVDIVPRSEWRYSGGGYTVLQLLLTDVTGIPFARFMHETVLEPTGMTESTYEQPLPESRWDQAATGYRGNGEPVQGRWHVYPEMAAAGLWTTPSDLARFIIEVQRARAGESAAVLSREMIERMLAPDMNHWGLGPAISEDGRRFGHGGSNEGFRGRFAGFIDEGRGAVVMTNSDNGGALASEVMYNIARAYGWPGFEPTVKTVVDLAPGILESYAGRYEIEGFGDVTVQAAGDRLRADVPGQGWIELRPESETLFFDPADGTQVAFVRENGRVTAFEVGDIRAVKVE